MHQRLRIFIDSIFWLVSPKTNPCEARVDIPSKIWAYIYMFRLGNIVPYYRPNALWYRVSAKGKPVTFKNHVAPAWDLPLLNPHLIALHTGISRNLLERCSCRIRSCLRRIWKSSLRQRWAYESNGERNPNNVFIIHISRAARTYNLLLYKNSFSNASFDNAAAKQSGVDPEEPTTGAEASRCRSE
jgi:hypothetical protein